MATPKQVERYVEQYVLICDAVERAFWAVDRNDPVPEDDGAMYTSDLARAAANRVLQALGLRDDEIERQIFASYTPEQLRRMADYRDPAGEFTDEETDIDPTESVGLITDLIFILPAEHVGEAHSTDDGFLIIRTPNSEGEGRG